MGFDPPDFDRLDSSMQVKGLLLTAVGTPVMAALCVGALTLMQRLWRTSQLDTAFWIGAVVFGGFSLLALGIVLRASARVWRTKARGPNAAVARWSPVLMLVGGVAGFFVAGRIAANALELRSQVHAIDCAMVVSEDAVAACLPVMERCDLETRHGPEIVVGRTGKLSVPWPKGLEVPDWPGARARVLCAWRALHKGDAPADVR